MSRVLERSRRWLVFAALLMALVGASAIRADTFSSGTGAAISGGPLCPTGPPSLITAPQMTPTGYQAIGTVLSTSTGSWGGVCSPWGYQYHWYHQPPGGSRTAIGTNSASYTVASSDVNDTITVDVWAGTDIEGWNVATATGSAIGKGQAPTAGAAAISGTVQSGQTLTATPSGFNLGVPTATYSYQWKYSTSSTGTYSNVSSGGTNSTYVVASAYVNDYLKVVITASNSCSSGCGSASATSAATSVVKGVAPTAGTAAISGTVQSGQTLTATPSGFNLGVPTATYSYQWTWSTSSSGTFSNISGATASTYVVASAYANDYLKVVITATNTCSSGCGAASASSAATTQVLPVALGLRREYTDIQQTLSDQESLSVNVANGNLTLEADDLNLPGIAGFNLDYPRFYNSLYSTSGNSPVDLLAPGWETTPTLNVLGSGNVEYTGQSGYEVVFTANGSNFTTPPGVDATLTKDPDGSYTLSFHQTGSAQDFTTSGVLTDYKDKNGNTITFNRSGGQLTSITDSHNHTISFTYNGSGQLSTITAPGNCNNGTCAYSYAYDAGGHLTSYTDPNNKTTSYGYNAAGLLTGVTVPSAAGSETTAIGYDTNNRVSSIQTGLDSNGNCPAGSSCPTTTFSYGDSSGSLCATPTTDVTAPDQQPNGPPSRYCFDSHLRVTKVEDPSGNTTSTDYTTTHGGSGCTDNNGNSLDDLPCSTTDANTNTTTYTYDANNNLLTVTGPDPDGRGPLAAPVTTYVYADASHPFYPTQVTSPATATDPAGVVTAYTYDTAGNTTETDVDQVRQSAFRYNSNGQISGSEDGDGNWTGLTYDSNGNVASRQTGLDSTLSCPSGDVCPKTTYTLYDAAGRVLKEVAPLGNVSGGNPADYTTTYTYDQNGRQLSVTDPVGHTTTYSYDGAGNQTTVTDPSGNQTLSTYDANNRVISVQSGLNYDSSTGTFDCLPGKTCPTTTYTYDANGNKQTETDPDGDRTVYTYYPTNQVESQQSGLTYDSSTGNYDCAPNNTCPTTSYTYYPNGNEQTIVDPRGNVPGCGCTAQHTTSKSYDDEGRLTSVTDPLGHTTAYGYDSAGNQTSTTDANGNAAVTAYDAHNRVTSVQTGMKYNSSTNAFYCPGTSNCPTTTYKYDAAGNEASVTDPNGNRTVFTYYPTNQVESQQSGLTYDSSTGNYDCAPNNICPTTTYTYDANGNKTSTLEPSGKTVSYSYDHDNRLSQTSYSDSTPSVSYAYDPDGNRLSMTDGAGTVTSTYTNNNQLQSYTRGSDTFSYSYDPAGNITNRTYPNGTAASYAYNQNEQLSSVTSGGNATNYTYDADGNPQTTTLPNGYVETRTYDNADRVVEVKNARSGSILSDFAYTLDPVGNPTTVVQTGAVSNTTTYSYEGNNRLIDVCFQTSCNESPGSQDPYIHWTYDEAGNRLTEARPSGTTSYVYNNQNELLNAGSTIYSYDANGNETAASARTFAYNAANQLVSTAAGGSTTTYTYDGDGNRLSAIGGGSTTNYLWDINNDLPQLALERDGSGNVLRTYLYGVRRIAMLTGGQPYYYSYDGLGSVVNVTSPTGATEWTYAYDPFGSIRTQTQNDPNAPTNPMAFTGEMLDPTTGLYDLRARQYDTSSGRFLSLDPGSARTGASDLSSYAYADGNPETNADPSGMYTLYGAGAHGRFYWQQGGVEGECNATGCLGGLNVTNYGVKAGFSIFFAGSDTTWNVAYYARLSGIFSDGSFNLRFAIDVPIGMCTPSVPTGNWHPHKAWEWQSLGYPTYIEGHTKYRGPRPREVVFSLGLVLAVPNTAMGPPPVAPAKYEVHCPIRKVFLEDTQGGGQTYDFPACRVTASGVA